MATVTFLLRTSKKEQNSIHVLLRHGQTVKLTRSTKFRINLEDWKLKADNAKLLYGYPKALKRPDNKNLRSNLNKLHEYIIAEIETSLGTGAIIDSKWLQDKIHSCFNRKTTVEAKKIKSIEQNNKLTSQIKHYIDNAKTKVLPNGNVGLSDNRIKGIRTFLNTIKEYEADTSCTIYLKNLNIQFEKDFRKWMLDTKGFSKGYSGKKIDDLKAIGNEARREGIEVNQHLDNIRTFSENKKDKIINTLNFDELDLIINLRPDKNYLINAQKIAILGAFTGLRYSDLTTLSLKHIKYENDLYKIEIRQQKTDTVVVIPILEQAEKVIKSGLPHPISLQKFNLYLKELVELAGIHSPTKGNRRFTLKINGKDITRNVLGTYPKHELISAHDLRRSFATNFYKHIPTPILMEITSHSRESTFLEYVGKPKDKDHNAKLMLQYIEIMKSKELEATTIINLANGTN
jgi:integrase